MEKTRYLHEIKKIKKRILEIDIENLKEKGLQWTFFIISGNLANFLPKIPKNKHYEIIKEIYYNRSLNNLDLWYPFLLRKIKIIDNDNGLELAKNNSFIFVSYHAGAYNLILSYLFNKKIPLCLVVSEEYLLEHGKTIQDLYKKIPGNEGKEIVMISSNEIFLLRKLALKLKEGYSVFFFIDGNTGVQKKDFETKKNLLKIKFLQHHIYVRQGIALLAYLSKKNIITITAERRGEINNVFRVKLVDINNIFIKFNNRKLFIEYLTKNLYKTLEEYLKTNYKQWIGWFYIHHYFNPDELEQNYSFDEKDKLKKNKIKLVTNEFIHLFKIKNKFFLIQKLKYEILEIDEPLFEILTFFLKERNIDYKNPLSIKDYNVNWNFIEELIIMKYLKVK